MSVAAYVRAIKRKRTMPLPKRAKFIPVNTRRLNRYVAYTYATTCVRNDRRKCKMVPEPSPHLLPTCILAMNFDASNEAETPCPAQPPCCDRYTSAFRDNHLFRSKDRATGAQAFGSKPFRFTRFFDRCGRSCSNYFFPATNTERRRRGARARATQKEE